MAKWPEEPIAILKTLLLFERPVLTERPNTLFGEFTVDENLDNLERNHFKSPPIILNFSLRSPNAFDRLTGFSVINAPFKRRVSVYQTP